MDGYSMVQADPHYNHPGQRPPPNWPPHMMSAHAHSGQASPGVADHGQHYPFYSQGPGSGQSQNPANPNQPGNGGSGDHGHGHGGMSRTASSLSLNLSSLTVTSPANLSPINPPQSSHGHPTAALSPVTPLSPPNNNPYHHTHHSITSQFQFNVPENTLPPVQQQSQGAPGQVPGSSHGHLGSGNSTPYDESTPQLPFDRRMSSTPTTGSRSSSASTSHSTSTSLSNINGSSGLLRKRSFSSNGASTDTLVEVDEAYDESMDTTTPGSTAYDDGMDMRYTPGPGSGTGNVSPVDGSGSGGEDGLMGSGSGNGTGDGMGAASGRPRNGEGSGLSIGLGSVGSMNILGKPMATNNFVTKLYQMISDPKSAHFIAWTEHGTSFVVSNVGEFSRSILGSHFKHNNFSSFVRQLNMYGFHKINRTPRAQRTSTDSQTWEFSHLKFLRGRPDLLDEIKRKALEPDPAVKHRVELPGEVAAQLGAMRDENRRVWEQVNIERRRADKLVNVVAQLWDVVGKGFPGSMPPFPNDLLDSSENPNIFVTSAQGASRYPPPLSMNMGNPPMHSMHHTMSSPNPSPTNSEFPASHVHPSQQHPQPLSRQHSFQHISYTRGDGANPSPMPSSSPGSISMDLYDNSDAGDVGRISTKRQRMAVDDSGLLASNGSDPLSNLSSPNGSTAAVKKFSRARSDSAPLGYGLTSWQGTTRPRSGSNLSGQRGVPNIGNLTRGNATPLLSMANPNPSR